MKVWWIGVIFLLLSFSSLAQRDVNDRTGWSFKDRVYLGGGLGLNGGTDTYGNRYFYFGLYPIVGYMVTSKFSTGAALNWQHYTYPDVDVTIDQYGISPFVRYNIGNMFLYSEYSIINTPAYNSFERKNYTRLLMGVGYSQPLGGGNAKINVMGLYDVIYNSSDRAFASPWVLRVFFSI